MLWARRAMTREMEPDCDACKERDVRSDSRDYCSRAFVDRNCWLQHVLQAASSAASCGNCDIPVNTNSANAGASSAGEADTSAAPLMAMAAASAHANVAAVAATAEQTVVVDSDLYHVELSNRGAVVRSWQLKKYTDSNTPPHALDVVNTAVAQQSGGWPLALVIGDSESETAANQALYTVSVPGQTAANGAQVALTAPAEVDFHWSDGHVDVTKQLKFDSSYVAELKTTVQRDGKPVSHRVAWNGGFGDVSAFREAVQTVVFTGGAGSITTLATKKIWACLARRDCFYTGAGSWIRFGGDRGLIFCGGVFASRARAGTARACGPYAQSQTGAARFHDGRKSAAGVFAGDGRRADRERAAGFARFRGSQRH